MCIRDSARQLRQVHDTLGPLLAQRVTDDPVWPVLAAQLRRLEEGGINSRQLLAEVAASRELGTATSPAAVLHHRLLHSVPDQGPTHTRGTDHGRSRRAQGPRR